MSPQPHEFDHQKAHDLVGAIERAQERFGLTRLQLGVLLEQLRLSGGWRIRADSFGAFLEEQRINDSAAYQYMRVARKLFFELDLSDTVLKELATVNMSTLDLACQVLDPNNMDEILAYLAVLTRRDAHAMLEQIHAEKFPNGKAKQQRREPRLEKLRRLYLDLPEDLRIDFRNGLKYRATAHAS